MNRIIFIKPSDSTFIRSDQHLLEKHFFVKSYLLFNSKNPVVFSWTLFKLFFFLLFHISKFNAVVTWFADYHACIIAFMAKLFRKKFVIFIGGQEAICYPELKKGVYYKKFRGACVKYALKKASLIIPNHKSLIYHENYYYDDKGKKDGIKFYIPDLKTKIEVIPNGYDTEKFKRDYTILKKQNLVLTIGKTNTVSDVLNKGFDLFVQVAQRNPEIDFVIIAIKPDHINWLDEKYAVTKIPNLKMIPYFCPMETMMKYFNEAKVFVQASITEGMPNTLGEAMLFECVPVGSNVNGIPDSIGSTGVIVYKRNVDELEKAIQKALTLDKGKEAREYILTNFSVEKREKELMKVFNESGITCI
jgi:glycosyltransferase involved in cell wall biosynthesis